MYMYVKNLACQRRPWNKQHHFLCNQRDKVYDPYGQDKSPLLSG